MTVLTTHESLEAGRIHCFIFDEYLIVTGAPAITIITLRPNLLETATEVNFPRGRPTGYSLAGNRN